MADHSEPEPDITLVDNCEDDYATPTAAAVQLLIEVADASLEYDRTVKWMLYAEAQIPQYWLFNLVNPPSKPTVNRRK
ncbi:MULTISPECIES: Uma2 family endonuclease [unclassified Thermosynechococcus]|uniref:Uma2 family endonuclease n=1 Tax=unclassified Thermosynechococcus TaxID=2622553 RepID=UPI0025E0986C|nr:MULTISPECIES: Uma2 family endonuclease [unclassified Thermosynechococcus]